jgi:hypothetical protein
MHERTVKLKLPDKKFRPLSKSENQKPKEKNQMKILVKHSGKLLFILCLLFVWTNVLLAQSGRRMSEPVPPNPAEQTNWSEVKYEGGMLGRNKSSKGTLIFDGARSLLIFQDKDGNKVFSIPYSTVIAAYADVKKKSPFYASAIANGAPYGVGLPALLIKSKARYLVLHYKEIDTDLQGIVTFKFIEKDEIAPRLETFVRSSGLTPRENIYVRKKTSSVSGQIP